MQFMYKYLLNEMLSKDHEHAGVHSLPRVHSQRRQGRQPPAGAGQGQPQHIPRRLRALRQIHQGNLDFLFGLGAT